MPAENEIDKKKREIIQGFAETLNDMGAEAQRLVFEQIEEELHINGGKIVADSDFVQRLNKITASILKRLQTSPKFNGPVSKFIKQFSAISDSIGQFQKQTNGIKVPDFEATKKVIIDEITDAMVNRGLNSNFVQPLRDIIYRNATAGLSLSQAKQDIKDFINGGGDKSGKLKSYLEQTAMQGVDMYAGAINKKLMETFNFNAMLVTGTLIDNSAPQCVYAVDDLNGVIRLHEYG